MGQMEKRSFAILLAMFLVWTPMKAIAGCSMPLCGVASPSAAVTFQGIGDVSGAALAYYSCARVYSQAKASTSTNLCDLVAVTGGAAVCTLRGSSSGYTDLTAYCPGSLTPSAACAAASGGSCLVSKAYNQVNPGTLDANTDGTLADDPAMNFSGLNSLPMIQCRTANASNLLSSTTTQATPLSFSFVGEKVTTVNSGGLIGSNGNPPGIIGGGTNLVGITSNGTNTVTQTASDNSYHAVQALIASNTTNSFISVDGSASGTGNAGTTGYSTSAIAICRGNGLRSNANIMEAMVWASDQSANFTAINSNQHSASNGYNF
jgi:hypothetical protein